MTPRRSLILPLLFLLTGVPSLPAQGIFGRPRVVPDGDDGSRTAAMVHVSDRRLTQRLVRARELITQKEPRAAIGLLQSLLDHQEDSFFQDTSVEGLPFVSLKQTASRLLGTLGPVGRRAYELEYGTTARQLLDQGQAEGGVELLERAARRYFHTAAGAEAAYALGNLFLDRGQPLAAAMQFDRLRRSPAAAGRWEPMLSLKTSLAWARSGRKQRARKILVELPAATRARALRLGGRVADVLGSDEAVRDWLERVAVVGSGERLSTDGVWNLWRGNRSRTASVAGVAPQPQPEWVFPTFQRDLDEPHRQGQLKAIRDQLQQVTFKERTSESLRLPAVDPLVIGDIAVFRSLFDVKVVHLPSGRHLWELSELNLTFDRLLDPGNLPQRSPNFNNTTPRVESLTSLFLSQRAWQDRTVGTLSTDGRYVFAVDDVGVIGSQLAAMRRTGTSGIGEWVPREYNRLLAIELASEGKLVWELGGPRGERQLELGGTFFLGPPLPLGGQLLCLGERDGEIRLWSLVGTSGKVRVAWSQGIAEPEFNILLHPDRRLAGLSPSYADGVLVCPTEAGLVVAVDLVRRQLLWSYAYRSRESRHTTSRQQAMQLRMRMARGLARPVRAKPSWFDPLPVISEGRVIITPRDSEELHCLGLDDGRQLWSQPRGDGSFVAAVHAGRVVVVGRSQVVAFRLADGEPAWSAPVRIPRPTGVGVRSGSRYHLPVVIGTGQPERGAILTLDLVSGRLLARTEIDSGRPLGNLVNGGGRLLALSPDELVGFHPDEALREEISRRLGQDADDPGALAIRGRQRLHRGEFDGGLNDLLASWSRRRDPAIRRLLVQALLDGLRFDFERYHERAGTLQDLFETPGEQLDFRRLRAEGLARTERPVEAFDEYLALAASAGVPSSGIIPLEAINQDLAVRRDRWVRARLASLYHSTDGSQRATLDARIAGLFDKVRSDDAVPEKLEQLVSLFAGQPVALQGTLLLLDRLPPRGSALRRESLLLKLRGAAAPRLAAEATAELVELWTQRGRLEPAREYLQELQGRYAAVEVGRGRTGMEQVRAWRADPEFSRLVTVPPAWKSGHVDVVPTVNEKRLVDVNTSSVPIVGPRPAAWRGWTFRLDPRKTFIMAIDSRGRERWRMTTIGDLAVPGSANRVPTRIEANYVQAVGHLLLIAMGNRFAVVDAFHATGKPRVLWTRNLYEDSSGIHPRMIGLGRPQVLGPQQVPLTDPSGRPMGHVGPLVVGRVTYQVGSTLYAADPLDGKTLWSRRQVARGSLLYGMSGYVFVEETERRKILVLSGDDGTLLATRRLPEEATVVVRSGRHLVYSLTGVGDQQVHCLDLVSGKEAWFQEIDGEFPPVAAGTDTVALLDALGRFQVLDVASGQPRVDMKLAGAEEALAFNVLVTPRRYIVMINRSMREVVRGVSNRALIVNGEVWGIARPAWREGGSSKTGPVTEATWGPLTIERQAIEPGQQRHLPVLVFVSRVYRRVQNKLLPRPQTEYSVLVLDQRNGQLVHKGSSTLSISTMRARANPDQQQIKLQFLRTTLDLTFTDQPPPKPATRPPGS